MRTKIITLVMGLLLDTAHSETLQVKVLNSDGGAIAQAAVYAKPTTPQALSAKPKAVIIDQIDKEFVNHLSVVQIGTPILFPNHDKIRHHVYSFSEAKKFELPLYQGTPAQAIVFDKAGMVTLGCNIHDWMSAYVYVVDTPFFALTDKEGIARLNLPGGHAYTISAWHPQLKKLDPRAVQISLTAHKNAGLTLTMGLKKSFRTAIRLPTEAGLTIGYR